jgi:hypothetical protein
MVFSFMVGSVYVFITGRRFALAQHRTKQKPFTPQTTGRIAVTLAVVR